MLKKYYHKTGDWIVENAICCHCGKEHTWDAELCAIYQGRFVCEDCYNDYYGYCNECGTLHKYSDMNDEIVCHHCQ